MGTPLEDHSKKSKKKVKKVKVISPEETNGIVSDEQPHVNGFHEPLENGVDSSEDQKLKKKSLKRKLEKSEKEPGKKQKKQKKKKEKEEQAILKSDGEEPGESEKETLMNGLSTAKSFQLNTLGAESSDSESESEAPVTGGRSKPSPFEKNKSMENEDQSEEEEEEENEEDDEKLQAIKKEGAFENFNLSQDTIRNLYADGVNYLFQVQAKTFKSVYDGSDVIVKARTGTGKTLAFVLPLVEKLKGQGQKVGRAPSVLTLLPTRELAVQVFNCFQKMDKGLRCLCVYGGVSYGPQISTLRRGVDVLVGTPGRIKDLVEKGSLDLKKLKFVVLDEVDRMLDMGFAPDVEELISGSYNSDSGENPQTLLFSATVPPWVLQIAKKYLKEDYKTVDLVGREGVQTSTTVKHLAIRCQPNLEAGLIVDIFHRYAGRTGQAIVFCETKKQANDILGSEKFTLSSAVLHGDIAQGVRESTLQRFRKGNFKVLVTTDVSARGLDIPDVDLVVQCQPPTDVDSYIHRSGRTGRAGRAGVSICLYSPGSESELLNVEKKANIRFMPVGPPQPTELYMEKIVKLETSLDKIPHQSKEMLESKAKELIDKYGALDAVTLMLVQASGLGEMTCRSILTSAPGLSSIRVQSKNLIKNRDELEEVLREKINDKNLTLRLKNISMGRNQQTAVFDVDSGVERKFLANYEEDEDVQVESLHEFPEDFFAAYRFPQGAQSRWGRQGFRGRGRGFFGGRGGRGGRGGFGGGRGGRGGFGGGRGGRGGFGGERGGRGGSGRGGSGRGRGSPGRGGGFRGGRGRGGFQKTSNRSFSEGGAQGKSIKFSD